MQTNMAWLEHARTFELDSRFLTLDELKSLLPDIQNQTRGALFTPSDARAEPELATRAIANQAEAHGAELLMRCAVRGLDIQSGKVAGVVTEQGYIKTTSVVCAGGAWSSYFCRHLDLIFPQLKVISSVMATAPTHSIGEQSIWSRGLGMRRRMDGGYNVAYGGNSTCEITLDFLKFVRHFLPAYKNSKEQVYLKLGKRFIKELKWPSHWDMDQVTPFENERVLNPQPDLKLLAKAYSLLGETFPSLKNVEIAKRWAGMIDVTPDELPIISTVQNIPGLILSTGYSGHGFGIGLGAGKVTADLVLGHTPKVDLSAFSVNRFLQ